jgi:hypothetical protein
MRSRRRQDFVIGHSRGERLLALDRKEEKREGGGKNSQVKRRAKDRQRRNKPVVVGHHAEFSQRRSFEQMGKILRRKRGGNQK